jgi:hypothetical protein
MDTPSLLRPQRSEGGAQLGAEKFRLSPRGEASALVDLVEVDQVMRLPLLTYVGVNHHLEGESITPRYRSIPWY